MKKPYSVMDRTGFYINTVWVVNSRNDVVAKCYSLSMAKRIAAALNREKEGK